MDLKNKKVLFVGWGAENKADSYMYQIWAYTLKKIFPSLLTFDTKENYFQEGKEKMNKNFLELIKKENPDCLIMAFFNDEFYLETLDKIKKINKNIKTVIISCDEDLKYDDFYRFISLFFDYKIISQKQILPEYKKDGFGNLFQHLDFNTFNLGPIKTEKKYDVTFIGRPKADRAEMIEYLVDNGINFALFGWDWYDHPKLKDVYKGFLNAEDYNKVINESKINLCFTKAGYQEESGLYNLKGKLFEVAECKSFQLVEYFKPLLKFFEEKKEIITFKTKEELLEKIRYYLKNEREREEIAKRAYKKINKKYNREKDLKRIFSVILRLRIQTDNFPKINKKIISLSENEIRSDEIKEKLKDYDYVCFNNGKCRISSYRNYIQAYSLEKTGKGISCCDYYVYSEKIGDIMLFRGEWAFRRTKEEFPRLLDINQLMVTKEFFLKNIGSFRDLFKDKIFNLINQENTVFVSVPLVSIKKLRNIRHENMKKAFEIRFMDKLFSLIYQRRIFSSNYIYNLLLEFRKPFILRYFFNSVFNKKNWDKLVLNQKYLGNSVLRNFLKKF